MTHGPSHKSVLIISYVFPPISGIGGRRWSKFAKYLKRRNIEVGVIASKNHSGKISDWIKDIETYHDCVQYLETDYPKYLGIVPASFLEKILYRIGLIKVKLFAKGNYYDRSVFWEKKLISEVERKIKEKLYNNLIVTCAPFRTAYILLRLKRKYPQINFIVDFRDPWTNNEAAYGFQTISTKRLDVEKRMERQVVSGYDYVVSVAEEMTKYFKKLCDNSTTKFLTIPNGFDRDDFNRSINTGVGEKEKIKMKFIFTGTFYQKASHHFKHLLRGLNKLKQNKPEIYHNLVFEFYGDMPSELKQLSMGYENVRSYKSIPLFEVYAKIREADACMLFLTDDLNYSLSTKFYEYLSQHKPIVVFAKPGVTSQFIEKNNLGYPVNPENIDAQLEKIYSDYKNKKLVFNPDFNIGQYDISNIVCKVEEILK